MGDQNETEQLLRNLTELSPHIFHRAYWLLKTNSAIWFTIKWFCLKKKKVMKDNHSSHLHKHFHLQIPSMM